MIDLKNALIERGCNPIHFKTDSVKIADYKEDDIQFVKDFGKKYGYHFSVEGVFDRLVLINDAVLIGKINNKWEPVGARFAHPYVFKTIFSKENVEFDDLVEVKSVKKGKMYIEMPDESMVFVGQIGKFCPVKTLGGTLYRVTDEGKKYAVTGTTGYRWAVSDVVKELERMDDIDMDYFEKLVEEAISKIAEFGDVNLFLGD